MDNTEFEIGLVKCQWNYEHPESQVSTGKLSGLFNKKQSHACYSGIGISFSKTNVGISPLMENGDYPFGADYPHIDLPPDADLLRKLADTLNKIAYRIEG